MPVLPSNAHQALLVFIGGGLLVTLLTRVIALLVGRLTARTRSRTDDFILKVVVNTVVPLGWVISAASAWRLLETPQSVDQVVTGLAELAALVLIVRMINQIGLRILQSWAGRIDDTDASSMVRSLAPLIRSVVWVVGVAFFLQNIGVQMAAIWALLSAGGIGAGLALKEPVQQFFEYITILLDKPFRTGDFIQVGDVWASVERVGVRSTRLRSINGEAIVMSNGSLTGGIIANYAEMERRRLVHRLGVEYSTEATLMEQIPNVVESVVNATPDANYDRCHFIGFGNSSLDFEVVYYIPTSDYLRAMNAQQSINLGIMKRFEELGIAFAFPTRTLHLNTLPVSAAPSEAAS